MDELNSMRMADLVMLKSQSDIIDRAMMQLNLRAYWRDELAHPRYDDPRHLLRFGHKVYSQFDEDGILAEIFRRIGVGARTFVEFGVANGLECNSLKLLLEDWNGLWIEGNEKHVERIRGTHHSMIARRQLALTHSFITKENINSLIAPSFNNVEIDLLSIDIDRNDLWVWSAIDVVSPRVVVIEYNATWRPPLSITVPYQPDKLWDGSSLSGASLEALRITGRAKGYELVGCGFTGVNAYFVRLDLCGDHFLIAAPTVELYEPPRYFMVNMTMGHPPNMGPLVTVTP